jgi:DNA polymerase delta subunit 1
MLKATNLLLRAARERGFLVPDECTSRNQQAEESPLTLAPRAGVYNDGGGAVVVLDYASLYPSIIVGYNLCYSTLLLPPGSHPAPFGPDCSWPRADSVETVELGPGRVHSFAKHKRGVVPEILSGLLEKRKAVKELIKSEADPNLTKILDLRQKALKLVGRSAFYFFN